MYFLFRRFIYDKELFTNGEDKNNVTTKTRTSNFVDSCWT